MSTANTQLDPGPDRHAPRSMIMLHGTEGGHGGGDTLAYAPDEIELACPACTLEWRDGWQHERSCCLRAAAPR